MGISKLRVAEREIIAAIRLLFDGGDAVPIYVLAASAREITTQLCEKRGVGAYFDIVQRVYPKLPRTAIYRLASRHAGFFKHADRDPEATLKDFKNNEPDSVLFIATFDFGTLCGGKPIEAQVFEAWFLSIHMRAADVPPGLKALFPKVRSMRRPAQIRLGKRVLEWARDKPDFHKKYNTAPRAPKRKADVVRSGSKKR